MIDNTSQSKTESNYLIFPGCVIQNRVPFLEKSARFVFSKLGINLKDAPFGCCPDPIGLQSTDRTTWLALGARNLAIAEVEQKDVISLCNGCTETLKIVQHDLNQHEAERDHINQILSKMNKQYHGDRQILHFVEILVQKIGLDTIKSKITRPLTGMKIGTHTGCHYARPSNIMKWDDPINPKWLIELVKVLGAEPISYDEQMLCCGSGVARNNADAANGMLKRKYNSLLTYGAQMIAVICPSCFQQLEAGQRTVKKQFNLDVALPVFYITELLALAMGASIDELGIKFHAVKAVEILKSFNFE